MLAFKRFVTVVVLVHLLLMLLFLLVPAVRSTMEGMDSMASSPYEKEANFFRVLLWVSVVVLGLQLIVENMDSSLLRRNLTQHEAKINELKAKMYDHQQRDTNPALAPTLPTSPPAAPANLGDYPTSQPLA